MDPVEKRKMQLEKQKKANAAAAKANVRKGKVRKKMFLNAYVDIEKYMGVRGSCLKELKIPRKIFNDWMRNDAEFHEAVEEIENQFLDFAELTIKDEAFLARNPKIMESLMKILLKKRGYDPAQKHEISGYINVISLKDIREKQ